MRKTQKDKRHFALPPGFFRAGGGRNVVCLSVSLISHVLLVFLHYWRCEVLFYLEGESNASQIWRTLRQSYTISTLSKMPYTSAEYRGSC